MANDWLQLLTEKRDIKGETSDTWSPNSRTALTQHPANTVWPSYNTILKIKNTQRKRNHWKSIGFEPGTTAILGLFTCTVQTKEKQHIFYYTEQRTTVLQYIHSHKYI